MSRLMKNRRKDLLAIAVYSIFAVALSWPLLQNLDTHILGDQAHPGLRGDFFFLYTLQHKLGSDAEGEFLHTTLMGYPDGIPLDPVVGYSLHLAAFLPLVEALGTFAGRSMDILIVLVLNGLAMHLLAREPWGRSLWPVEAEAGGEGGPPSGGAALRNELFAYMAGFLYAFGPYTFLKLQQGFIQKAVLFLIPLVLLYLFRFLRTGRSTQLAACGGLLIGVLAVYPPYAVYLILFLAPLVLLDRTLRVRLWELRYKVFIASVLTALLFLMVALSLRGDPRPMTIDMQDYQWQGGFLDLLHPFRWHPYARTFPLPPSALIPTLPLGFPILITILALLGAVLGVSRTRVPTIWALLTVLVMAGPFFCFGDCDDPGARQFRLPFYYLGQLHLGAVLKFPIRMYPLVLIALLFAAGRTLIFLHSKLGGRVSRWGVPLMALVLGLVVVENRLVFPEYRRFIVEEARIPSFYEEYRGDHVALHLPIESPKPHDYLFASAMSHHSLVNGYMDHVCKITQPPTSAPLSEKERFVEKLRSWGVDYIVVHLDGYHTTRQRVSGRHQRVPGEEVPRWLEQLCGPPKVYEQDRIVVYFL